MRPISRLSAVAGRRARAETPNGVPTTVPIRRSATRAGMKSPRTGTKIASAKTTA
jgi:hypothetical protein